MWDQKLQTKARHNFYTQCLLVRSKNGTTIEMVSWIPSDIVKTGQRIRIRENGNNPWSENWTIAMVYSKRKGLEIEEKSIDYKSQRKTSDI